MGRNDHPGSRAPPFHHHDGKRPAAYPRRAWWSLINLLGPILSMITNSNGVCQGSFNIPQPNFWMPDLNMIPPRAGKERDPKPVGCYIHHILHVRLLRQLASYVPLYIMNHDGCSAPLAFSENPHEGSPRGAFLPSPIVSSHSSA
jgi:hypothetical protein